MIFFQKLSRIPKFTYFCITNDITLINNERKNTMAEDLKDNWKKVGKDWASLGEDLGKSLIKSVKAGVSAATKWAEDEPEKEAEAKAEEAKEEPKAEE